MKVNESVIVTPNYGLSAEYLAYCPEYAKVSELSDAMQALWTNRVPQHEPWPRVLQGDSNPSPNKKNEEYKQNIHHYDQFDNVSSPEGMQPIGKVEGDEDIPRKKFWRR